MVGKSALYSNSRWIFFQFIKQGERRKKPEQIFRFLRRAAIFFLLLSDAKLMTRLHANVTPAVAPQTYSNAFILASGSWPEIVEARITLKQQFMNPFAAMGEFALKKMFAFFLWNCRIITKLMKRNVQFYPAFCIFNCFFYSFFFVNLFSIWCYREHLHLMAVWYLIPIRTAVASWPLNFNVNLCSLRIENTNDSHVIREANAIQEENALTNNVRRS